MRRAVSLLVVLVALAPTARADDAAEERRAALARAQPLVTKALDDLRAGRTGDAAKSLSDARAEVPDDPVVIFDHAVALERGGHVDEARAAYRAAAKAGDASSDASRRARHNLALSHLESARTMAALLRDDGALDAAAQQMGQAPGGHPVSAEQLRSSAIQSGLKDANEAVSLLRDAVRAVPGDADSVRNLVLAQRVRRFLEEEQKKQPDQSGKGDEGDQDESGEQGEDEQQQSEGADDEQGDQQQQDDASQEDQTGDGQQSASDSQQEKAASEQRDVGKEEAQRMLDQLLEAAAQRAREIEQIRAAQLRRGAVEKDW